MKKQGNKTDFGQTIVYKASNQSNPQELKDLLNPFGLDQYNGFVIEVVEKLVESSNGQVIDFGGTVMVTVGKGEINSLYEKVGGVVLGLYIMNNQSPELAKKFIDKTSESKEKFSEVINYFYKSSVEYNKDTSEQGYNGYVQNGVGNNEQCFKL